MKIASLVFLLSSPSPASEGWSWHQSFSPHFAVSHEMAMMPSGLIISLEKMHSRLRLDLAMFSPWMSRERLKLYLYKTQESYRNGEFEPPAWSNGIALYKKRTVVAHDQPEKKKLLDVISHETTHLLFESYWGEAGRSPPDWLNEGLAMLEEGESTEHPESTQWYQAMVFLPDKPLLRLQDLAKISPTKDLGDDKAKVELWYTQAYSLVHFLFRKHSRLQFKNFCSKLRDGKDLEESLWLVYRYRAVKDLEKAWLDWLREPGHRKRLGLEPREATASAEAPAEEAPKKPEPGRFGGIKGFKPLETRSPFGKKDPSAPSP